MPTYTQDEDERRLPVADEQGGAGPLAAEVVATDTEGFECTIYPVDAEGLDLMTRWITAEEGSFVNVEDVR